VKTLIITTVAVVAMTGTVIISAHNGHLEVPGHILKAK
jgi:hypothetical protein